MKAGVSGHGADLTPEAPNILETWCPHMTTTEPIIVFTETDASRAEIIKSFLRGEGIRCFLDGEQTAGNLGISAFEVRVMVPSGDADHARKLIEQHEQRKKARC